MDAAYYVKLEHVYRPTFDYRQLVKVEYTTCVLIALNNTL